MMSRARYLEVSRTAHTIHTAAKISPAILVAEDDPEHRMLAHRAAPRSACIPVMIVCVQSGPVNAYRARLKLWTSTT